MAGISSLSCRPLPPLPLSSSSSSTSSSPFSFPYSSSSPSAARPSSSRPRPATARRAMYEEEHDHRPSAPRPPPTAHGVFMAGNSTPEQLLDGLELERHQRRIRGGISLPVPADGRPLMGLMPPVYSPSATFPSSSSSSSSSSAATAAAAGYERCMISTAELLESWELVPRCKIASRLRLLDRMDRAGLDAVSAELAEARRDQQGSRWSSGPKRVANQQQNKKEGKGENEAPSSVTARLQQQLRPRATAAAVSVLDRLEAVATSSMPRILARARTPRLHGLVCRLEGCIEILRNSWADQMWRAVDDCGAPEVTGLREIRLKDRREMGRRTFPMPSYVELEEMVYAELLSMGKIPVIGKGKGKATGAWGATAMAARETF